MQNNYERLFDQLSDLLNDDEVQNHLDQNLKPRIDRLYAEKGKKYIMQKINDLSKNDPQELFEKSVNEDISNNFQRIVLKERSNQNFQSRKHLSNLSASKQKSQFYQRQGKKDQKANENVSSRPLTNKSRQKLKKNTVSYSNLLVNKSKSKQKSIQKYTPFQNLSKQSQIKVRAKAFSNQKTGKKLSMFEKGEKENLPKYCKKQTLQNKNEEDKQFANLYLTKKKSNLATNNDSKQVFKRLAVLQTQPSRLTLSSNKYYIQPKKQVSVEKQINFFEAINTKQQQINDQKKQLQQLVQKLKQKIEKQQMQLIASNKNVERYQREISKICINQGDYALQAKISRKKSQNFFTEAKQMQKKIVQANKTNDVLVNNISQENYLIDMYQTVIEEMKIQLKIEQQQKTEIKKRLNIIKNTEKMVAEKYISRNGLSNQIFQSMKQSLKKWG